MIRRGKVADLRAIREWLEKEEAREVPGFLCNWSWIETGARDGNLRVYVDPESTGVIGFMVEEYNGSPSLLQIREEYQRQGIGEKLVADCIARAIRRGHRLLWIQCAPDESRFFWQAMGFMPLSNIRNRTVYAYRLIPKALRVPKRGEVVSVAVRFFPEDRKYNASTHFYQQSRPIAVSAADGNVHFSERVLFHESAFDVERDTVVQIELNGREVLLEKAKYKEAERLGVRKIPHGWYLDGLTLVAVP